MPTRTGWWEWKGLMLAWLLLALPAFAADYYVNDRFREGDVALPECPSMPEGIDGPGCGKCERPCMTPQFAYNTLPLTAGDTVHLNTGTYDSLVHGGTVPVLMLVDASKAGTAGRWLTFSGPLDDRGQPLRGPDGRPLAVIHGRDVAIVGVLVGVNGIRLRGLGFTAFRGDSSPYCGSGVQLLTELPVTSFSFRDLDFFGHIGSCSNAIDIDAPSVGCRLCEVRDSRMSESPEAGHAIWIDGQHGVEIAGNTITGWGRTRSDAVIYLQRAEKAYVHHNLIQDNAGEGIFVRDSSGGLYEHNTFRNNLRRGVGGQAEINVQFGAQQVMRNNIIAPAPRMGALRFQGAFGEADYNGYVIGVDSYLVEDMGAAFLTRELSEWQAAYGQDKNSLSERDGGFASPGDSHLRSTAGRFDPVLGWVADSESSPFIDRADPSAPVSEEQVPHGLRANLGAYGNTWQASHTPIQLSVVSGNGQRGPIGVPFAQALVVQASVGADVSPAAVGGIPLHFQLVEGVGAFGLTPLHTDASGRAEAQLTPTEDGVLVVEVSVVGAPGIAPARFALSTDGAKEPGPDPGTGVMPLPGYDYLVSCGCAQGGGGAPIAALMLLLGWARARRMRRG